ncbi:YgeY family selenium metabolism-linked hydrolase [candidate division LCP-89 bacterium B3_LCP]|uniref:YgeY family selenium metabolism-linked hydrolase n=1 Tax=candidate division LCP-89 bacterium B3_LCP TaxID=2012998 RepID=A0A532URP4_UNCL8|nr:MAG: YgeY family selenium metabolism-linked hydrolase [candidate division LCP-89 bacterium B3_LCP]
MKNIYTNISERSIELQDQIADFLMKLVGTPSFSCKEKEVIAVIQNEMQSVGFDEIRIDGLGSVIGRIGSGSRLIAFDAHIDTVYAGDMELWDSDPFKPVLKDGRVWGRGSVDQKGGMAALVYAGKMIKELGLNDQFTILMTGTVMEEDCDGLCWQYLIREENLKPELVVITEPTNLNIHRGQRGRMEMEVAVKGVSSHGSAPERGENAIYKASKVALEIEKLHERLKSDSFLGKGSIAVTEIKSQSPSLCAVPDGASIHLDRRLTLGETRQSAVEEVQDAAAKAGCPEAQVTVPVYTQESYTGITYPADQFFPPWVLDQDSVYLKHAASAYRKTFAKEPVIDKWTFSTNGVAIAGMFGIPCLGMGPGDEILAHAPNESCPVEHLSSAAAFYVALVAEMNSHEE